jgi:surface antigen
MDEETNMRAPLRRLMIAVSLAVGLALATVVTGGGAANASATDCLSYGYACTPGYTGANASGTWAWSHYGGSWATTPNGYHNCTLYAAWRLQQSGMTQDPGNWGNATDWAGHIGGGNHTPAVGSIAWYGGTSSNQFGHVAYVEQVSGSNVFIRADNFNYTRGSTNAGWVAASSVGLFLHPHDVPGSPGGNLASNGGFEGGAWSAYPGTHTNVVAYRNGQVSGESARSGLHYLATNTSSSGGGVYEDIPLTSAPGGLYCGSAWVRTQIRSSAAASGQFVVWLLGGSYNENGVVTFSGLGSATSWRQVSTCVASTTPHSSMRIQFYPTVNGATLNIDDVDVH